MGDEKLSGEKLPGETLPGAKLPGGRPPGETYLATFKEEAIELYVDFKDEK